MSTHTTPAQVLCSWEAPGRPPVQRSTQWYVIAAALVLLLGLYAIATAAWSFAVVLLLGTGLYLSVHECIPRYRVTLRTDGILVNERFTPWSACRGFWMLQGKDSVEVFIERKNWAHSRIRFLTGPQDPTEIFLHLVQSIPHFPERTETLLDAIIRICKL